MKLVDKKIFTILHSNTQVFCYDDDATFFYFRLTLGKQLFIGNEVLQGCLIHVRSLCEAASGSLTGQGHGESAVSLIKLDKSVTLTLEKFKEVQRQQNEYALKQLNALRDKIIEIAWESCAVSSIFFFKPF